LQAALRRGNREKKSFDRAYRRLIWEGKSGGVRTAIPGAIPEVKKNVKNFKKTY
jgi:hypothetical protein